jgi:hypothetical protein
MEHFRFKNAIEEISIAHNEIEAAIKSLPKRKVQDLTVSQLNSTRPSKKI